MDINTLKNQSMKELNKIANDLEITGVGSLLKNEIIFQILSSRGEEQGILYGSGVLEILPDGYGFLRSAESNYLASLEDIYVNSSQIKRYSLRYR